MQLYKGIKVFLAQYQITLAIKRPAAARAQTAAPVSPSLQLVVSFEPYSTRSPRSILALNGGGIAQEFVLQPGLQVDTYMVSNPILAVFQNVKLESGVHRSRVSVVIRKHLSTRLKSNSHGKELYVELYEALVACGLKLGV